MVDSYVMFSGGPGSVSLSYELKHTEEHDIAAIYVFYGQPGGEAERDTAVRAPFDTSRGNPRSEAMHLFRK